MINNITSREAWINPRLHQFRVFTNVCIIDLSMNDDKKVNMDLSLKKGNGTEKWWWMLSITIKVDPPVSRSLKVFSLRNFDTTGFKFILIYSNL